MKLSNTSNITWELFFNIELKKEIEFLESLLNIKNQIQMNNQQNVMSPQMNAQFMQQNPMIQQQVMMQQLQMLGEIETMIQQQWI